MFTENSKWTAISSIRSILILNLVISLITSCQGSSPEEDSPSSSPDPSLAKSISYTISPHYGLDANNNEIIDMPNNYNYVQEPLEVSLDFSILATFRYPSNQTGSWRWTITPVNVSQIELFGNLPVPISTIANATPINDGTKLVAYTNEPKLDIQLFEGDWNIELAIVSSEDPAGDAIYWKVVPLTFEDYLIVQIGDSYSSGEGMPELVGAPYGVWGDDGTVQNYPISDPNYYECLTADDINECLQLKAFGTSVNFEHEIAHRSHYTWGSLAALEIEKYSNQTSVTYINLAASGARIRHIYSTKNKVRVPIAPPHQLPGQIFPSPFLPDRPLEPQLGELDNPGEQLIKLIGERHVDALVMTFGGNDVGFAAAIAAYVVRDSNESFRSIEHALANGDWTHIELTGWEAWAGENLLGAEAFPNSQLAGFNNLGGEFQSLFDRLSEIQNLNGTEIYISEYPDPIVVDPSYGVLNHDNAEVCPDPILTNVAGGEIGRMEQNHARHNLIIPLNEQIALSAAQYKWNLVDTATLMYGSPICDENRMVNRYEASAAIQGDHTGTVHPNEKGYRAMADALLRVIHIPNALRDGSDDMSSTLKEPDATYPIKPENMDLWHFVFDVHKSNDRPEHFEKQYWGTYGLNYPTERVYLNITGICSNNGIYEGIILDARIPIDRVDFLGDDGGTWDFDYTATLPEYSLRIVSKETNPVHWQYLTEPKNFGAGDNSIVYRFPSEGLEGKELFVVLTTPLNADISPVPHSKVNTISSYENLWGLVQLRTGCILKVPPTIELPDKPTVMPPTIVPTIVIPIPSVSPFPLPTFTPVP